MDRRPAATAQSSAAVDSEISGLKRLKDEQRAQEAPSDSNRLAKGNSSKPLLSTCHTWATCSSRHMNGRPGWKRTTDTRIFRPCFATDAWTRFFAPVRRWLLFPGPRAAHLAGRPAPERDSIPPDPIISALIQNTRGNPNAEPIAPNITGPSTRTRLLAVSRKPSV